MTYLDGQGGNDGLGVDQAGVTQVVQACISIPHFISNYVHVNDHLPVTMYRLATTAAKMVVCQLQLICSCRRVAKIANV